MGNNDNYDRDEEQLKKIYLFLDDFKKLLLTINRCGPVLFKINFRKDLDNVIDNSVKEFDHLKDEIAYYQIDDVERKKFIHNMERAGLLGIHLNVKLEWFYNSFDEFNEEGDVVAVEEALAKGNILLKSLVGAIPGVGSLLQELVDFIHQELKKRLKSWFRWR